MRKVLILLVALMLLITVADVGAVAQLAHPALPFGVIVPLCQIGIVAVAWRLWPNSPKGPAGR